MSNRYYEYKKPVQGNARKLKDLLVRSDNRICADCSAPDPKWASANIGVFICLKCSDVHRSLGPDISKVLSVTLDEWSDDEINSMIEVGGNSYANSIYEAFLPKGTLKPKAGSSNEDRTKFIRSKYELQEFLKPSLRMVSSKSSFRYDSGKILDKSYGSDSSRKQQVFDHDLFSADDIMGEAEVNLQMLITAAMELGDLAMLDDMQYGTWSKSGENALAEDSPINVVGGKLKQEVTLVLQNVECGEIVLELEWIPVDQ